MLLIHRALLIFLLLTAIDIATLRFSFAGISDTLFGSEFYRTCRRSDGDAEGCKCAEIIFNDAFDDTQKAAALSVAKEAGKTDEWKALGFNGQFGMSWRIPKFVASAGYQCSGVKYFLSRMTAGAS